MPHYHPGASVGETQKQKDKMIEGLHMGIRFSVRILAILMCLLIFWGVIDVIYVFYERLMDPPIFLLTINDILATFGAFLAVLIAIEIFTNITLYLRNDLIHVNIVIATALMAIARKVIVLDFNEVSHEYLFGMAVVILSLGITYWLIHRFENTPRENPLVAPPRSPGMQPPPAAVPPETPTATPVKETRG